MPTFNGTGATTGNTTAAPTVNATGDAAALQLAQAAAVSWLNSQFGKPADISAAQQYASVFAETFAAAGGSYQAAYQAAYNGFLTATAQDIADFQAGHFRTIGPAEAPAGIITILQTYGTAQETDVAIQANPQTPSGGQRAGLNFDLPSFGVPGTTGSAQPEDAAAATDQAPVLGPPTMLTLADQLAFIPSQPKPGVGVVKPLRQQMKKFSRRRR